MVASIPRWKTAEMDEITIIIRKEPRASFLRRAMRQGMQMIPMLAIAACIQGSCAWLDAAHR